MIRCDKCGFGHLTTEEFNACKSWADTVKECAEQGHPIVRMDWDWGDKERCACGKVSEKKEPVKPFAVDLFCGLGGWAEGLLAEGWDVVGFDIERHDYGTGGYPGQLVLQDVRTLHGSQFRKASLIVASPPCQAYSYRAMPWKRAKALPPPDNSLFEACFRIQTEACEAAGHHIPLVVENVRGAQKWVGRAAWHFGSYFLWGDLPALMPIIDWSAYGQPGYKAKGFSVTAAQRFREGVKNGKDWFGSGENCSLQRRASSRSDSRKAASAAIAKIPFPLAQHIAQVFYERLGEKRTL